MDTQRDVDRLLSDECNEIKWLGEGEMKPELRFQVKLPSGGKIDKPIHLSAAILDYTEGEFCIDCATVRFGAVRRTEIDGVEERKKIEEEVTPIFEDIISQEDYSKVSEEVETREAEFLHAVFGEGTHGHETGGAGIPIQDFAGWLREVRKDLVQELNRLGYVGDR